MSTTCEMCGRALRPAERGRPRRYCSRACRTRAYRARMAERPATVEARRQPPAHADAVLDRDVIVRAALACAHREGVAAVSMRRVAADLGVGVMSLYRYVAGREELNDLMVDTVFADHPLPEPGPDGWRDKLELSARQEWALHRRHPWLSQLVVATTRPPNAPHLMAYTDWRMRALAGHDLDFATLTKIAIMIGTYLQSAAAPLAYETQAARRTRHTREQWTEARRESFDRSIREARLPMVSEFGSEAFEAAEPDNIFEFGLHRMLDGIAVLLDRTSSAPAKARERDGT
ncbi:TetR/AcrR family transcriptional regulator [Nonomuraea rhodomycinica]|uniref:TetR/AcrR family transcriptional regulator n=1 Tax=Nonomuraea rhodomycinica TaxID=1712872 RepID=A0A7Y6INF0_9ACTN|nr:TetR/AcrR family transcriptional regulator [Nonomuraea rhodomycinica]NUW40973.1 TetR/AcrR family transcriptional regulator [Nonomuraea rhodomycinica]